MKFTAVVMMGVVIFLGIFDLVLVTLGYVRGKDIRFSISRWLQWLPRKATFFVCCVFYVMGHAFGYMNCPDAQEVTQTAAVELTPEPDNLQPPQPVLRRTR